MRLKCTSYTDLGNNFVEIHVRDCDDNPMVLPEQIESVDIMSLDGNTAVFTNMRLDGKSADMIENGFLVHPYIYRYDTMS